MKPSQLLRIVARAVAVIGLGGLFLLTYFNDSLFPIMTYWPVALVLIGVWGLISSRESRVWGALFTITGMVVLLHNQGWLTMEIVLLYWPTVLIAVGTFTLVRSIMGWIKLNQVILAEVARSQEALGKRTLFG